MILKLRKDYFTKIFCTIYAIALILSYEIHIFDFQPIPQIISYCFFVFIIFLNFKSLVFYKNPPTIVAVLFFFWLVISLLIRIYFGFEEDFSDILKVSAVFFIFFSYLICPKLVIEKLFLILFYIIFCTSIFNFFLFLSGGELFFWEAIYGTRYSGIYYLHNIAGALFGYQILYSIYGKGLSNSCRLLAFFLAAFGLIFSFSKGSIVAFFGAFLITSFSFSSLSKKIFPIFLFLILVVFLYFFMVDIEKIFPQFRFFSGLNERDEMWASAFGVLNDTRLFLFGGGEGYLHKLLGSMGKEYTSTHNYFVDTLIVNGGVALFVLFLLSFLVIYGLRYRTKDELYFSIAIYLLISVNKSKFSLGGITLLSVMLSFIFVYAIQTWDRKKDG